MLDAVGIAEPVDVEYSRHKFQLLKTLTNPALGDRMTADQLATKVLRPLPFLVALLAVGLLCSGAKSATVTLSYKIRVATARCDPRFPHCTTDFVPFLETFDVTLDPSVPVNDPTTAGLDIISINRPYSSAFSYLPPPVGQKDGLLTVATHPGGSGCRISDPSSYCLLIQVDLPITSIDFVETTAAGETWAGQNGIPHLRRGR
jgi:hypothetical protein